VLNVELARRVEEAKRRAHGRWPGVLQRLGVDAEVLGGRNQPCPACGGTDRFQFTDKYGDGNYVCRGCGSGDGFALLERCLGWTFIAALKAVEDIVGQGLERTQPGAGAASPQGMRQLADRIWQEAKAVEAGDAVATYLAGRGIALAEYPRALRTHGALGYYVKQAGQTRAKRLRTYAAMVAAVQDRDGQMVTLHRTYLENGAKAPVADSRKLLAAGINGGAVRLFEPSDELAIAEGIETALAVHVRTGKPVWAALGATNLEKLWLPPFVTRIAIYADHDRSYTGQAAAYALARRIKTQSRGNAAPEVAVHVPRDPDTDWADVLRDELGQAA
jgi:putative DNA primase/helicase